MGPSRVPDIGADSIPWYWDSSATSILNLSDRLAGLRPAHAPMLPQRRSHLCRCWHPLGELFPGRGFLATRDCGCGLHLPTGGSLDAANGKSGCPGRVLDCTIDPNFQEPRHVDSHIPGSGGLERGDARSRGMVD